MLTSSARPLRRRQRRAIKCHLLSVDLALCCSPSPRRTVNSIRGPRRVTFKRLRSDATFSRRTNCTSRSIGSPAPRGLSRRRLQIRALEVLGVVELFVLRARVANGPRYQCAVTSLDGSAALLATHALRHESDSVWRSIISSNPRRLQIRARSARRCWAVCALRPRWEPP